MEMIITNSGMMDGGRFPDLASNADQIVYEVVRVMEGVPLFLEDHFSRLRKSMIIQHLDFRLTYDEFKSHLTELINKNQRKEGNVKFVCFVVDGSFQWAFSFIPHSYPTAIEYEQGVSTDFLLAERQNPNAKVIQSGVRDRANQMIADQNLYEILLVDRDGMITEGSRSNVFFVKSDIFYTAPASMILEGITRQKIVECLKRLKFSLVEQAVSKEDVGEFDSAFLTGTSPKILPVRAIGKNMYNVKNLAVVRLINEYNQMIQDYIGKEKIC